MKQITPRVLYLDRNDWGANPQHPRLGGPEAGYALIPRLERRWNIVHHTVGVDNDATKNVWENLDEVKKNARFIQTVRPDLGADVPYNFLKYLMSDYTVVICEGRGYDRSGAHTAGAIPQTNEIKYPYTYFNVGGIATSCAGNFEDYPFTFDRWAQAINEWNQHLKETFRNIGTATVCGAETCGHKHFAPYSNLNQTACPGMYLYAYLPRIKLSPTEEEDEVIATQRLFVSGTFAFLLSDLGRFPFNPNICADALSLLSLYPVQGEKPVTKRVDAEGVLQYALAEAQRGQQINDTAVQELRWLCKHPESSTQLA